MFRRARAQFCFALLALLSPAFCAAVDVPASPPAQQKPFIGLLLPLNAPDFARAADIVRQGCQAALGLAENSQQLQILATDAQPESIVSAYEAAVQRGASVIVGPLTRSGVAALAASGQVSVATLALNVVEGDAPLPPHLYVFGVSVEPEARMVARIAYGRNLREAVVVQGSTPLAQRVARAFADEWLSLGGRISGVEEFHSRSDLSDIRNRLADSDAQMTFLAAEADEARIIRPYLNNKMAVFATSQVNDGTNDPLLNSDLNGVRFVDMPWLVQPDHAAVMVYPHPPGLSASLQRLYALGIDSCRIATGLFAGRQRIQLDGVTGKILLSGGNAVERQPVQAVFRDGSGVAIDDRK